MANAQTVDLFEGLPLDYRFLEEDDGSVLGSTDNRNNGSASSAPTGSFVVPNDQMLLDSDVPGSSPTNMMAPKAEGEDLLTPLSFSFNSSGGAAAGFNYRVAPQHKHKRVRSNPDVLQGFGMAGMALNATTPSLMGPQNMRFPSQHKVMPINPVQMEPSVNPMPLSGNANPQRELFQEMDEFLMGLSWSELNSDQQQLQQFQMPTASDATAVESGFSNEGPSPVAYRTQRIQDGVNELKMKRKRPMTYHSRHHSNPVDLLHNLDQFRVMAEQKKQQEQNMNLNRYANYQDPTTFPPPSQSNMQHFQFQVPPQIASGAAHSLHSRRSSLGSNLPQRAAARRRCGSNRSSGLSMDMSHMNLGFLSVPEESSMANPTLSPPPQSLITSASSSGSKKNLSDDANRKLYKCGRCGQPKVGHICTMPDQRNNWTQVDLEVTKGLKIMRINCHIMPVKSKWKTQCDDHKPPQQSLKDDVKSEEEVEAEPLGL